MPAVMYAANEVAVESFLKGEIRFVDIPDLIVRVMDAHQPVRLNSISDVLAADVWGRTKSRELLKR
jgi:1-deoxy-D-xylulose-5-phosphate reductoisomerase